MARPSLNNSAKYKLLIVRLGLPRPHVRGLLEEMWDVGHNSGNPVLGTPEAVEAAAMWTGEPGTFFKAISAKDCNWIDETPEGWIIHDYWDHAPDYVKGRLRMENLRKKKGNGQTKNNIQANLAEPSLDTMQTPPKQRSADRVRNLLEKQP